MTLFSPLGSRTSSHGMFDRGETLSRNIGHQCEDHMRSVFHRILLTSTIAQAPSYESSTRVELRQVVNYSSRTSSVLHTKYGARTTVSVGAYRAESLALQIHASSTTKPTVFSHREAKIPANARCCTNPQFSTRKQLDEGRMNPSFVMQCNPSLCSYGVLRISYEVCTLPKRFQATHGNPNATPLS